MNLLIVAFGILLLLVLILRKLSPVLALLITALVTGLLLGMPVEKVVGSINTGVGATLSGTIMVLALGAMLGQMAEKSGAARRIVMLLTSIFGLRHIQWAVLLTGLLVGIPLFYNAGFVVLIPLVFTLAKATKLPLLSVGLPMAASLSVTHGFLPPHPGPLALAGVFKADIGRTLLFGLLISLPVAALAGVAYTRIILPRGPRAASNEVAWEADDTLPSSGRSLMVALLPVGLIAAGTLGAAFTGGGLQSFFVFLRDPLPALLLSVLATIMLLRLPLTLAMDQCLEGVKSIAMILLIIAAGGAFKQILLDSGTGLLVKGYAESLSLPPLVAAWLITALFRVTLGSATVAALTASGIVAPFIGPGVSPELMVLSVGAGSLALSHVNDTGFWMFKEYFGLTLKETFSTWTVMETLVALLGLAGVLLVNQLIS